MIQRSPREKTGGTTWETSIDWVRQSVTLSSHQWFTLPANASVLSPTRSFRAYIFWTLSEARSWLHRSQILQVNTRLKALGEIYKIYIPLHLSDLKNSANFRRKFWWHFHEFQAKSLKFCNFRADFCWKCIKFYRNFTDFFQIPKKNPKIIGFFNFRC